MKTSVSNLMIVVMAIFIAVIPFNAMSQTAKEYYEKGKAIDEELQRAGGSFRTSKDGEAAEQKVYELFTKACELDTELCKEVEGYSGELQYRDLKKRVYSIYERKCSLGEGKACYLRADRAGNIEWLSEGQEDYGIAVKFYNKGCELKHVGSCYNLGKLTSKNGDPKKKREALPYFEKACKLGSSGGCIWAGNIHGSGNILLDIPADTDKFISFYQKACELNQAKCIFLASAYLNGGVDEDGMKVRIPKDANKGNQIAKLFEKYVKKQGTEEGYSNLYWWYTQRDGEEEAYSVFQGMCNKRNPNACITLGNKLYKEVTMAYMFSRGKLNKKDKEALASLIEETEELFRKACEADKSYCAIYENLTKQ